MRWVVAAALATFAGGVLAGCGTPKRAIIGGSVTLGTGGMMMFAASQSDYTYAEPSFRPFGYYVGLPLMVAGAIILGAGIAAALETE